MKKLLLIALCTVIQIQSSEQECKKDLYNAFWSGLNRYNKGLPVNSKFLDPLIGGPCEKCFNIESYKNLITTTVQSYTINVEEPSFSIPDIRDFLNEKNIITTNSSPCLSDLLSLKLLPPSKRQSHTYTTLFEKIKRNHPPKN